MYTDYCAYLRELRESFSRCEKTAVLCGTERESDFIAREILKPDWTADWAGFWLRRAPRQGSKVDSSFVITPRGQFWLEGDAVSALCSEERSVARDWGREEGSLHQGASL